MAGGRDKMAAKETAKETGKRKKSKRLEKGSGSQPPTEMQPPSGSQPNPITSSIPNAEYGFVPLVQDPRTVSAEELPKFVNHPKNRYLFRDEDAWRSYNGRALTKPVSQVFYYMKVIARWLESAEFKIFLTQTQLQFNRSAKRTVYRSIYATNA